jgi:hypothetical protein
MDAPDRDTACWPRLGGRLLLKSRGIAQAGDVYRHHHAASRWAQAGGTNTLKICKVA